MTIDMFGGIFSLLSLAFREKWDTLDGVAYGLVVVSKVATAALIGGVKTVTGTGLLGASLSCCA